MKGTFTLCLAHHYLPSLLVNVKKNNYVSIQYLILWPAAVCQDLVCYSFNNRCHNLHMIFSACKPCAQMFSYQPSLGVQVTALTFNFIKLFPPKFLLSESNGRNNLSCGGILWNSFEWEMPISLAYGSSFLSTWAFNNTSFFAGDILHGWIIQWTAAWYHVYSWKVDSNILSQSINNS